MTRESNFSVPCGSQVCAIYVAYHHLSTSCWLLYMTQCLLGLSFVLQLLKIANQASHLQLAFLFSSCSICSLVFCSPEDRKVCSDTVLASKLQQASARVLDLGLLSAPAKKGDVRSLSSTNSLHKHCSSGGSQSICGSKVKRVLQTHPVCSTGDKSCRPWRLEGTGILVFEELSSCALVRYTGVYPWSTLGLGVKFPPVDQMWQELLGFLALSMAWGFLCSLSY